AAAVGTAVEASRAFGAEAVSRGFLAGCMGLFGVSFLVACGWRLRQLRRGRGVVVLAGRDGLACVNGGDLFVCNWDEVEEVEGRASRFQAQIGRRVLLTVRTAGGVLRLTRPGSTCPAWRSCTPASAPRAPASRCRA